METVKALEERALELLDAIETNLEQPIRDGGQSPQLHLTQDIVPRQLEELRDVIQKVPSVAGDPEKLAQANEALHRILAWSRHHHEESVPALQNTLKLIHEETANVLGV